MPSTPPLDSGARGRAKSSFLCTSPTVYGGRCSIEDRNYPCNVRKERDEGSHRGYASDVAGCTTARNHDRREEVRLPDTTLPATCWYTPNSTKNVPSPGCVCSGSGCLPPNGGCECQMNGQQHDHSLIQTLTRDAGVGHSVAECLQQRSVCVRPEDIP